MPGFTLYTGNRLEALADKFAETVTSSPLPVMTPEYIVLQSMGMLKWLTVEVSRRTGIWSNCNCVFPNRMAGDILNSFFPGSADERFFDKDIMTWKCMDVIRKEKDKPVFSEPASYIKDDISGLKLFQMSSRIIDVFDQYMTFRPEMIMAWDRGAGKDQWQPELWRAITSGMAGDHPPGLLFRLFGLVREQKGFAPVNLPARISVFGISYLPLYHLNVLRAASLFADVNLFVLNPSSGYWGNILTRKEKTKIINSFPVTAGNPEDILHLDEGNTLLASFGRTGRDFLHHIFSSDIEPEPVFIDFEPSTLLSMVQHDIYSMDNPGKPGEKHSFTAGEISADRSVTVNSCHGPVREAEILHDYILDLLNTDSSLSPADILVMTPDIEKYAGPFTAVFGKTGGPVPAIPFRVVDRKLRNEGTCADTFFTVLSLRESRFTSAGILAVLECSEVREKFSFTEEDCGTIRKWVRDSMIFWGIDGEHKRGLGLPAVHENTWRFGLDRMLMGGMMYGKGETSLGILPYTEIEGGDLAVLGRFISFFSALCDIYDKLGRDHSLECWGEVIIFILEALFISDAEMSAGVERIYSAATELAAVMEKSGFSEPVSAPVIIEYLDNILSDTVSGMDFVSGSLTFCGMLPMRSIPRRVICLIGMNDSAFPRKSRALSFDLVASDPRRGDRSVRDEDRYLFLETLVSAGEKLYISYTGRSASGNSELNPSVVVSELLDYIDDNYTVDNGAGKVRDFILRTHRIHSYNPVYFTPGGEFYTYMKDRIQGARSFAMPDKQDYSFIHGPLPPLSQDEKSITVKGMAAFLLNPSKTLLNGRLGLYLNLVNNEFIEEEPFTPDYLDLYRLNSGIMDSLDRGVDHDRHLSLVRASGILPHSVPGTVAYESSYITVKSFYDSFSGLLTGRRGKLDVDLESGGFRIRGTIDNIYGSRMIFFRYANAAGKDILNAWISHLVLCASGAFPCETLLISRAGIQSWQPVAEAEKILATYLDLYEKGMTGPLPLFPRASFSYADTFYDHKKGEPGERALKAASAVYSNSWSGGDTDDPYIRKIFGDSGSLPPGFEKAAQAVYFPAYDLMVRDAAV
jgi:exodeoxyribonuclease V gamma subunit